MTLDLRRSKKDFEVNEVDPISKACQDYLKSEDEINPYGTGNRAVYDEDEPEEFIGHT